jgi:hypothetical protein
MGPHAEVYSMLPIDAFGNVADIDQTKHKASIMAVVVIVHTALEIWHEWDLLNEEVNFAVANYVSKTMVRQRVNVSTHIRQQQQQQQHGKGPLARLWRWLVVAYGVVREQV